MIEQGLIELLEQLRSLLDDGYAHRAHYFKYHSENKENCIYYQKSMQLFELEELPKLLELLGKINPILKKVS